MTRTKISQISLIALASFTLPLVANAEHHEKSKEACEGRKAAYQERIAPYDTNGDGELSDAEKLALKKASFDEADLDKNGGLTLDEMVQLRESKKSKRKAMRLEKHFSQMDKDGDGVASFEEFSEASKKMSKEKKKEQKKSKSYKKQMREHVLKQYDTDGDGKLSDEEKSALKRSKFETADANSDGKLSQEEIAQFKENERAKMREMMQAKRFEKVDENADGMVSFDEFSNISWEKKKDKRFHKCS